LWSAEAFGEGHGFKACGKMMGLYQGTTLQAAENARFEGYGLQAIRKSHRINAASAAEGWFFHSARAKDPRLGCMNMEVSVCQAFFFTRRCNTNISNGLSEKKVGISFPQNR